MLSMSAIAAIPGSRAFAALGEAFRASGGTAPGNNVSWFLNDHQAGLAVSLVKLVHPGQIFGFERQSSLWIPMFQFSADDLVVGRPRAMPVAHTSARETPSHGIE